MTKNPYLLVFLLAIVIRALLNFSIPLVPGLGGGYYLVQIREILENGSLAIPDMPLIFYLNALVVKLLSALIPDAESERLIIGVYKCIDCLVPPMILYPLYKIQKDILDQSYSFLYTIAIAGFIVLSPAVLEFCSDAQKNSVALVFMTFHIYYFLSYLKSGRRKDFLFTLMFLFLIALTHFGTFVVSIVFLSTGLIVILRKKAILIIIALLIAGAGLVWVFDPHRALSMGSFWVKAFSVFISPRLIHYPLGIFNYASSFFLIYYVIRVLRRRKSDMPVFQKQALLIFLFFIAILSFPFLKFEFGRRLGLMLFVPQSVLLLFLYQYFENRIARILSLLLIILISASISQVIINPKPLAISNESFADMTSLEDDIGKPEKTIIFVRHGLEWWVAWELGVNIAMPHVPVNDPMRQKYDHIYYLVQKKGENHLYPGKPGIFIEPVPPDSSRVFYDSEFFTLYETKESK